MHASAGDRVYRLGLERPLSRPFSPFGQRSLSALLRRSLLAPRRTALDPKATFEPHRNCPLPFLQQSFREQRKPVLMTRSGKRWVVGRLAGSPAEMGDIYN
jgi:hypothetical protein